MIGYAVTAIFTRSFMSEEERVPFFYINLLAVDNSSLLLFSTLSIYQEGRSSILTRYDFVSFRLYTFHAIFCVYVVIL